MNISLGGVEHEKSFITSGPVVDHRALNVQMQISVKSIKVKNQMSRRMEKTIWVSDQV